MDDWSYWCGLRGEWKRFWDFPWIIELATKYGYDSDRHTIAQKHKKYAKPLDPFGRITKKILHFTSKLNRIKQD